MSREEIIRIFRSETIGATPSGMTAGELATNLADRKLFIGGSQGDNIAFMAISSITGTANEIDVMVSATGSVVIGLVGSAGSLVGLATTSLTGVASFDPRYFTVGTTGHVGLTGTYQVTGHTVVAGYGINTVVSGNTVTVNNTGVTGFNGLSGNVSMTGAGALVGRGNNTIDARLATDSLTGVASFNSAYLTVSNGAVSLASAYQVTGQTVVSGYGINTVVSGNTVIVNNTGVTGFNGLSGNVSITGSGALFGFGNNAIGVRNASASVTGVASFNSTYFTVGGNGAVSLASAYQVTGQTVVSGYGINTVVSGNTVTVNNIGVTGFNGLSGNVSMTGAGALVGRGNNTIDARLASSSLTGVASFNSANFTISATGHVGLTGVVKTINGNAPDGDGNYSVSVGATITGDGGALGGDGVRITARLASATVTGVASFNSAYLTVSNGAVSLASAYQVTGQTVVSGYGINTVVSNNTVTVNNIGVTGFNGLSGNVSMTGAGALVGRGNNTIDARLATANLTGVASFNSAYLTVSNGAVSLASAYQVTGQTVVSGYGINTVVSGNTVTVNSIGVTGFNGLSGNVSMTGSGALFGFGNNAIGVRNASASVTGVASFNSTYFNVGGNGAVTLASAYQVTGQTVVAGYGINTVVSGNTVTVNNTGVTGFNGLSGNVSITGAGALFGFGNNAIGVRNASSSLTGVASFNSANFTISATGHVGLTGAVKTINNIGPDPFGNYSISVGETVTGDSGALGGDGVRITARLASASVTGVASFNSAYLTVSNAGVVSLASAYQVTGQTVVAGYGINTVVSNNTITVNNRGVTGFNGLSGNVSMTGSGALFGFGNNAIGVRNASSSLTGVASFDPRYFTVGATGHVGLTATFFSGENYPVPGGFSANGFTGDRLLLATGPANDPFRNYIRYENQWFQTGVVGVVGVTGDFGAVQGKPQNLITARLATNSLTGVASFASQNFKVTNGRVTLTTTPFVMASSGLGATGDEDGNLISLYLDLNNVADYDSGKTLGVSDAVFVYDTDESGIIKTKKTTIGKMLYDTDAVFSSSTQNQLQKSKSGLYEEIQYGVVLGSIEPTSLGLIIGASAYEYFTQNTIKSFNGCTGDISITGTANQVIVTGISCSQIVIGLPTSITITGTMNADRFIGRMDGGAF